MFHIKAGQTRNYGKLSQTFEFAMQYEANEGSMMEMYSACVQRVDAMFEDFETNILPKVQYKQAEQGGNGLSNSNEWIEVVEIMKEVKDGKESIRLRTKPGTYFNKFGVAVYPECENYDLIVKALGTGYSYKAQNGDNMRAKIQTEGSKKATSFMMDILAF